MKTIIFLKTDIVKKVYKVFIYPAAPKKHMKFSWDYPFNSLADFLTTNGVKDFLGFLFHFKYTEFFMPILEFLKELAFRNTVSLSYIYP
jgi:hypothetical protein